MQIAKKLVGESSITFAWADGTSTEVSLSDIPSDLINRAALHGLSQKLGDSYSGCEGNVDVAKGQFDEVLTALMAGDWNRKGGSTGGVWVEAIAQAAGVEFAEALEKYNAADADTQKAMKAHPAVKAAKAAIDYERAKARAKSSDTPLEL